MDKSLILLCQSRLDEGTVELVLKTGKALGTTFYILSPINRHTITKNAANEGMDEAQLSERMIHDAYSSLYTLEHRLTQQGMEVTIKASIMSFPEDLIREIRHTNPRILIVAGRMDPATIDSLYTNLLTPILLIPTEE
jgi:hypothetical protein